MNSCSTTVSGSFYVDNATLSGIYDYYYAYGLLGYSGFDNSTGCVSNTNYISYGQVPSGTNSLIIQDVITSSTTFANKAIYYSDSSYGTEIASMITGYKEVSVGDNVTGLTTTIGGSNYPNHASKVTYKEDYMEVKRNNLCRGLLSKQFAFLFFCYYRPNAHLPRFGRINVCPVAADNLSASRSRLNKEKSTTAHPSDWSSNSSSSTTM